MTNQASIKYISSLLDQPGTITDDDHNSIALFRQTYPYFVPARYILAAAKQRKSPYAPAILSELQSYMGNWMMLGSFLDASTLAVTHKPSGADGFVTSKKSVDKGKAGNEQDNKPVKTVERTPEFIKAISTDAALQAPAEVLATVSKPVIEIAKTDVPPVAEKAEEINATVKEVVSVVPPVAEDVKILPEAIETSVAETNPAIPEVIAEPAKEIKEEIQVIVPGVKAEIVAEPVEQINEEVIAATPVVEEIKEEAVIEPVKEIAEEVKTVVPPVAEAKPDTKAEAAKAVAYSIRSAWPAATPAAETKPGTADTAPEVKKEAEAIVVPPAVAEAEQQAEVAATPEVIANEPAPAVNAEDVAELYDITATEAAEQPQYIAEAQEDLLPPVYVEDYFLQQGLKISADIPEEIDELKEVAEMNEEDKSLMVMMSFSEWLLHFKSTTEKQKEEKQDQKALKTMWQKEKLAAAMEEEDEEIPETVFEMAVNSIAKEDGLASESLADIYIKQGKYDKAIEMYRKLSLRNPKKNAYFARRIEEVLKEKQS